jgi:nitrite reductase/ring-hydroxylating ferredoxin subunit
MREVNVGPASEFTDPGRKLIGFERFEVAVFKLGGEFFAYLNHCPHMGGPACQGKIIAKVEEDIAADRTSRGMTFSKTKMHVVCPWHGFEFDIRTGVHPGNPKARLREIKVAVSDGDIIISVPEDREHVPVVPEADISVSAPQA